MAKEKKKSTFFADFKKFISRGNIVDMAVGVIIGSAFSAIVTALTQKIIMPLINLLLSMGGENGLEKAYTFLKVVEASDGTVDLAKSIYIDWGAFLTAIINFFLIALVLFMVLRIVMKASTAWKTATANMTNKELKAEKREVKAQAKEENRPFKEVWEEHLEKKAAEAEAKKAEEEANKPKVETQEELLKDIRDLLLEKQKKSTK